MTTNPASRTAKVRPYIKDHSKPFDVRYRGIHHDPEGTELWSCAHGHKWEVDAQACADRALARVAKLGINA